MSVCDSYNLAGAAQVVDKGDLNATIVQKIYILPILLHNIE